MTCPDAFAAQARWREHFAKLEAGCTTTFHELAAEAGRALASPDAPHPRNIASVPSLTDLRRTMAATKVGKAAGLDSIPPELSRFYAHESAMMLHPLLLKMLWTLLGP